MTIADKFVYDHSYEISKAYVYGHKDMMIPYSMFESYDENITIDDISFSLLLTEIVKKTIRCKDGLRLIFTK